MWKSCDVINGFVDKKKLILICFTCIFITIILQCGYKGWIMARSGG
jgi:hypothetical protein